MTRTGSREDNLKLKRFHIRNAPEVLFFHSRLDCVSASAVNAVHPVSGRDAATEIFKNT